ncbi:MAG: hypothetical protein EOO17_05940 [Chloroflexi bacterium]|nr:MAG: hypothetical protein EOO17_05940 [Chloroflexota bacterium]
MLHITPSIMRKSRNSLLFGIVPAVIVGFFAFSPLFSGNYQQQSIAHAATNGIEIITPTAGSYANSSLQLKSRVNGMTPNEYEMFWAVGNGEWNRLPVTNGIGETTIDVSSWNWQPDNTYQIRFIALVKDGWRPIENSTTFKKGTAPVSSPVVQAPAPITPDVTQPLPSLASSESLYVDPQANAAKAAAASPTATNKYIASQPASHWYGEWSNISADISGYVNRASSANATPVIVLYNIPHRDCWSYSTGGANDYVNYQTWIKQAANAINGRKAIVVLEPDALASMDCLSSNEKTLRLSALKTAVATLKTGDTSVYLDAGHAQWHSVSEMSNRLKSAGIDKATGFSLNVSNFRTTADNTTYGKAISAQTSGKTFVIDTSRNGKGPATNDEWCNPFGRGLGKAPTLATGDSKIDGYLWIKTPGESDGACGNGAPAAGQWWQKYADELYRNRIN